jgi:pSer/pThr/pTyr-binding forkhead associated (FHA) protein
MVFWRDGRYWIEDRRSENGTYLDGKIVGVGVLFDNVRVQLGRASLVFCIGTDAEQRAGVVYANERP